MDDEALHKISMKLRKGRAKALRARGCGDLADILEDPNIKSDEFKLLTQRNKEETALVVDEFTTRTKLAEEQNKAEAAETRLACDQTSRALDNINNTELQNSIKDYVEEEKKKRKQESLKDKKLRKKKRVKRVAAILLKRQRAGAAGYSTATSPPSGPQGGAPGASKVKDPRFSRRRRVKVHTEFQDAPPGTIPVPKSKTVDHDDDQEAN
jgi:hypothetical protein